MQIQITKLPHGADLESPAYATEHAAGMDLRAAVTASITIAPGKSHLIPTGFALAIPVGHEAQIRPRSGLALIHGVTVLNTPGTIDADYRAEVGVILVNHGRYPFTVNRGDRIAQMVVAPVARVEWKPVAELPETGRGAGGFGSTGG